MVLTNVYVPSNSNCVTAREVVSDATLIAVDVAKELPGTPVLPYVPL